MSDNYAYVACTCFRDGLTSEPPVPRSEFDFDQFGNVKLKTSKMCEDDPKVIHDWRFESVCAHAYDMRLIECIWLSQDWESSLPGRIILSGGYPNLRQILENGEGFSSTTVLATPELARLALAELDRLNNINPGGTSRVILDGNGNTVWRPVEQLVQEEGGFASLTPYWRSIPALPDYSTPELLQALIEVGVEGMEFVVRTAHDDPQELLRASTLAQQTGTVPDEPHRWPYPLVTLIDPHKGTRASGYMSPIDYDDFDNLEEATRYGTGFTERAGVALLQICAQERTMLDECWALGPLHAFLEASIQTGNPVVGYYSGCSVGF